MVQAFHLPLKAYPNHSVRGYRADAGRTERCGFLRFIRRRADGAAEALPLPALSALKFDVATTSPSGGALRSETYPTLHALRDACPGHGLGGDFVRGVACTEAVVSKTGALPYALRRQRVFSPVTTLANFCALLARSRCVPSSALSAASSPRALVR